jgi:hypothetical protein
MTILIMQDNSQQIEWNGVLHIQGDCALGKGLCGLPVLRCHKFFHKLDERLQILWIGSHLTHEGTYGLRIRGLAHHGSCLHSNSQGGIFKTFFQRGKQHEYQSQRQYNDGGTRRQRA